MSLKNVTISLSIKKDGLVIFGDVNNKIKIDMTRKCALSRTIDQIVKQVNLDDLIGKSISLNYDKKDVSKHRRVEKITNESIKLIISSGDFILYGHEFKKLTYVNNIDGDYITINDENPLNEDNFKVLIKITEAEFTKNNSN